MTPTSPPPRGIRNHNPGNIDRNQIKWEGMADDQSDPRFVVFDTPEHGIRALAKVLLSYQRKHGLYNVADIIGRWAPPAENDTGAYAAHVAVKIGVGVTDRIDLFKESVLAGLVTSIIAHENANYAYPETTVLAGIDLALGKIVEV
ncbi:MAG: structural protein [Phaeospirillum sp.]|nr:structural protein [Phaeospirillum sp.]